MHSNKILSCNEVFLDDQPCRARDTAMAESNGKECHSWVSLMFLQFLCDNNNNGEEPAHKHTTLSCNAIKQVHPSGRYVDAAG
jgi:hypothetical protein